MRELNLNQLFPYSVGFEHLDKLFDAATRSRDVSYPPYNIAKLGEDQYRITMAVAGFGEDDLEIEFQGNQLSVRGKAKEPEQDVQYLWRGIGTRAFERTFQLADHVRVHDARLVNGLLEIDLVRELPEAMKPRRIEIQKASQPKAVEGKTAKRAA